jgi:hypothetical protein
MIEIVDDFLPEKEISSLVNLFTGTDFPWYYRMSSTFDNIESNEDAYLFYHYFVTTNGVDSSFMESILPVCEKLNIEHLYRAKVNLTVGLNKELITPKHVDMPDVTDNLTSILYITGGSGDTILYDKEVKHVSPKPNRLVTFPGNTMHSVVYSNCNKPRVTLNLNYRKLNEYI